MQQLHTLSSLLCSVFRVFPEYLVGVNGDEDTPVPIPNTEVKLISVDNTWLATAWEDRTVPVRNKKHVLERAFCDIPP